MMWGFPIAIKTSMMMCKITKYISREYDQAWEFWLGLVELNLPPLAAPVPLAPLDLIAVEMWKLDLKVYHECVKTHDTNMGKVFCSCWGSVPK